MAVRRGPSYASFANMSQSLLGLGQGLDNFLIQMQNSLMQSTTSFASPGTTVGTTAAAGAAATGGYYYKLVADLLSGLF
jgi:hypothetical protein